MLDKFNSTAPARLAQGSPSPIFNRHSVIFLLSTFLVMLLGVVAVQTSSAAPWARLLAAFVITWWFPGMLIARIIQPSDVNLPAALLLAMSLGLGWMMSMALVVYYLSGPILPEVLIACYFGGGLLLGVMSLWVHPPLPKWWRGGMVQSATVSSQTWLLLLALLGVALLFRLPGLGYHEFHRDEVTILQAARQAIEGASGVLASHYKGPGEILVSIVGYRAIGNIDELTARLPFALMSVASVLAIMLMGRRFFSNRIGFLAGLLLTVNGFAIGLSRIAQYQGGVLLFSVAIAYAAWEFAENGKGRWLQIAIVLVAFGTMLHYEILLILPLLCVCAWLGWRRNTAKGDLLKPAARASVVGVMLIAVSYVPLAFNENIVRTQGYLSNRLGDFTNFNWAFFVEMGTLYNSIYFFVGLLLLLVLGSGFLWRTSPQKIFLLILWFLPNFVLYLFVMQFPGTHFYTMAPAWSLLAAVALERILTLRSSSLFRWGVLILLTGWLIVSANYARLIFFQQEPEYLINYPKTRTSLYWAPYGDNIPEKPRFGFPILEGWKAAGILAEWGYMGESYTSNERSRHLSHWYLAALDHDDLAKRPDTVFIARHLQERNFAFDEDLVEREYQKVGDIRVRGEPRIELWRREPLPVPYVSYDAESFERAFDGTIPLLTSTVNEQIDGQSDVSTSIANTSITNRPVVDIELSDEIRLDAASLREQSLSGGDQLHGTLVWRARRQIGRNYKVFVHVVDAAGELRTQWDGYPGQNTARTSSWAVDEPFVDHVLLPIPTDLAGAEYRVLVGLYDEETGERVGSRAVDIGTVLVN